MAISPRKPATGSGPRLPAGLSSGVQGFVFDFARAQLGHAGVDLVHRGFYSPLPDIEHLPRSLWERPSRMPGVDLGVGRAIELLRTHLRTYVDEFQPAREPTPRGGFFLDNESYGPVDAEILYAMIRHDLPGQVVEFGSGASSHVIAAAAAKNFAEGAPLAHRIYDPYPFTASPMGGVQSATVSELRAEDLDAASVADQIDPGDILFVDTTHTVRTGGDVTWLFLELLPRLQVGVLVHVHDVFLPYEYPRSWVVEERHAWAEQYLLHAILMFSGAFEVVFPAHAIARAHPRRLAELVPSFRPGDEPGAFWIRRVA